MYTCLMKALILILELGEELGSLFDFDEAADVFDILQCVALGFAVVLAALVDLRGSWLTFDVVPNLDILYFDHDAVLLKPSRTKCEPCNRVCSWDIAPAKKRHPRDRWRCA